MITSLVHGVGSMISNAEGAIVKSAEITEKVEESIVPGMVSGVTEIVKTFHHTHTKEGTVAGTGDLTLVAGVTATVANSNFSSAFITGGKITLNDFKYKQALGVPSEWSYGVKHYPFAS